MHRRVIPFFVIVALFYSCAPREKQFTLIDRETLCTIVLDLGEYDTVMQAHAAYDTIDWFDGDTKSDDPCRRALTALELQKYISLIIGVPPSHLPIVSIDNMPAAGNIIFIGAPQHPEFKKVKRRINRRWRKHKPHNLQDFRIDSFFSETHQGLVLSGRSSVATLYAAYELLTRWGVRWFAPEPEGEYTPHYPQISIYNMHLYAKPSFKLRGFWMDAQRMDTSIDTLFITWMGRNRLNLFSNTLGYIGALKQRGFLLNSGRRDIFSTILKPYYQYRYNHPTFPGDDQYPIDPYMVSEHFKGDMNNDNKLTYAEAHPEWFGIEENTSDHMDVDPDFIHICLSYPEAVTEFAQTIVDKLCYGEWQTCDIADLWTPPIWCTCEKCQRMGNDADKLLYLVYHVNKAIQKADQNASLQRPIYVHGYAAGSALTPPSVPVPKDFHLENTTIFLFTGPRCYNHYIIDTHCIDINIWFAKDLWTWLQRKKLYSGDIGITENYNAEFLHDLPTVHSNIMTIDIPAYAHIGVQGLNFQHVRMRNLGTHRLTNYQFARQTWDAHVSIDTLKQEFFDFHYPGISKTIKNYFERIELAMATATTWRYFLPQRADSILAVAQNIQSREIIVNERFLPQDTNQSVSFNSLWENTYHLIFEARYLMDELLETDMPEYVRRRVEELNEQLHYAELLVNLYDNIISFFTHGSDEQSIKDEAIFRLVENARELAAYDTPSPLFADSCALHLSGIKELVEQLARLQAH
ncbi:DUF4838 domain-containing protein [candidate division KSB1 bacterium]|nr:DUF4838 domain-containing protein [candidate division KSB1 bacterium]RQW06848.1 MAG: DUF4838 domain-containing protein [candidate division KSB1 bacterium]